MIGAVSFAAMLVGLVLLVFGLMSVGTFDVLFAVAMGTTVMALMGRVGARRTYTMIGAVGVPVAALGAQLFFPEIRLSPYLAIVIINGFVAYVFGRGLVTGRTPLIVQLIEIGNSGPPPEARGAFSRYVYGQCWVWTIFGSVTALAGLAAMLLAPTRDWLDPTISILFGIQILWFVLAHQWARLRYKRPETWIGTIRIMSQTKTWSELEI